MNERAAAPAARVHPRGHSAVFGAGSASLARTAVAVFDGARDTREALLFMTDDSHVELLEGLADRDAMLGSGRLRLVRTDAAYEHRDPTRLLAAFEQTLRGVLSDGWSGMRVVADNTPLASRSEAAFDDWLRWEHVTHRWQEDHPAVGVCWFDTDVVSPDRVDQLASIHPDSYGHGRPSSFRLLAGPDGVRLLGDLDPHEVDRLVGLLGRTPHDGELTLDVAEARYVHHTLFSALERGAPDVRRIRITGARGTLRRVWDVVGDDTSRVELV